MRYGMLFPYQCPQVEMLNRDARRRALLRVPEYWHELEVAQGCTSELAPVVTYKERSLSYSDSGGWIVAYTEHMCKTASIVLLDV